MIKRLHHVGVAVPGLDAGARVWEILGLTEEGREDVVSAATAVAMFPVGETRVELLEPLGPDTPVGRFLASRGPGIHHLCFEVDDIDADAKRLRAAGIRTLTETPQPGAHGARVLFLHPKDTLGVLVELNQLPG